MDGNILPYIAGREHPVEEKIKKINDLFERFYGGLSPLHERLRYSVLVHALDAYHKGTFSEKTNQLQSLMGYPLGDQLDEVNKDFREFQNYYFSEIKEKVGVRTEKEFFMGIVEGIPPNLEKLLHDLEKRYQTEETLNVDYIKRWLMYNKLFSDQ